MKNTFGQNIAITLFGESHGPAVGVVIDGLAPGTEISKESIDYFLSKRRPALETDTSRVEPDEYSILSGVFNGRATGSPITIIIPNKDVNSKVYEYGIARPSHVDYSAHCKYRGYEDYRGGGHFSGRITAALVVAGGIIMPALENKGIYIGSHILECCGIKDSSFLNTDVKSMISSLKNKEFPVIDAEKSIEIQNQIIDISKENDSVGGVVQTGITGLPKGLGQPWFDSVESMISHIVFSIGGIKGIEFGSGFSLKDKKGSVANDQMKYKEGNVEFLTNNNGGINGGITNGMPIVFNCVVKPTPSISKEQQTINFIKHENSSVSIKGRHDPAIIRRICPVIDSAVAIVVYDFLVGQFGIEYMLPKT